MANLLNYGLWKLVLFLFSRCHGNAFFLQPSWNDLLYFVCVSICLETFKTQSSVGLNLKTWKMSANFEFVRLVGWLGNDENIFFTVLSCRIAGPRRCCWTSQKYSDCGRVPFTSELKFVLFFWFSILISSRCLQFINFLYADVFFLLFGFREMDFFLLFVPALFSYMVGRSLYFGKRNDKELFLLRIRVDKFITFIILAAT